MLSLLYQGFIPRRYLIILPHIVIGRLCSVTVALSGHLLPYTLRKHAYSNILKILQPKKENFQIKKRSNIFFIFLLKTIDCGYSLEPSRRGGSNEYPQSIF